MRLLVVEDEIKISDFLKRSLEAECFAVDVAEDGKRGLNLALTNDYDLIILDNILPHLSGLQICQMLRRKKRNVPILVLSVKAEPDLKVKLLNAGADDYLVKPFSVEELIARVRALMRRQPASTSDVLRIDDLVMDLKKLTVRRNGRNIELKRKEFMVLEYMMRNSGRVLSRSMIMEHVWDISADPFSNTIDVHMTNLRKKIDSDSKTKLIKTVVGRGYRMDDPEEEKRKQEEKEKRAAAALRGKGLGQGTRKPALARG